MPKLHVLVTMVTPSGIAIMELEFYIFFMNLQNKKYITNPYIL